MTSILIDGPCKLAQTLIEPIERAVKSDRVTNLAGVLTRLDANGAFADLDVFAPPREDRYARKLIWEDPDSRFVIVALTWLPGQTSPLHDHAGLWGAEIVAGGAMRETPFRLVERGTAERYRFAKGEDRIIEKGGVGILTPPLEYHDFGNAGGTTAYTVHVYGGNLRSCRSFAPTADGWYTGTSVNLAYDV